MRVWILPFKDQASMIPSFSWPCPLAVPTDSLLCPHLIGKVLAGTAGGTPASAPQIASSLSHSGLRAFSLILVISSSGCPENLLRSVILAVAVIRLSASAPAVQGRLDQTVGTSFHQPLSPLPTLTAAPAPPKGGLLRRNLCPQAPAH